jgi:uncharacterized protein (DUF1800 family)
MRRFLIPAIALLALSGAAKDNDRLTNRQRALHALSRLSFGARPGDADRVMAMGVNAWIAQQLHPEAIPDRAVDLRVAQLPTLQLSNVEILKTYYLPLQQARREAKSENVDPRELVKNIPMEQRPQRVAEELQSQRIVRAAESERQLNEVMVDFWMNHFNVFAGKGLDRFLLTSYERDTIRPRIWGRFEDLLMATAKSPAMLFYLDNAQSRAGALNENYAREIMELHTLGVDGGYSQQDVTEMARVLTGWSIGGPRDAQPGTFIFRPRLHDSGEKTVLGICLPPGGGMEEGERMIRILAHQPATARRIATKLCQRLVSDDPPRALVDRVAKRFLDTGGDLRQTVKAVIDSPEFWDASAYRAKIKSPFEYVISAIRAVGAHVEDPMPVARALQQIGEPLYGAQPPTGYSDKAEAWMNTGALINRLNFALALAADRLPGVPTHFAGANACVDDLAQSLTGGALTEETRRTIAARGEHTGAPEVAGMILGSPEFQRQ